MQAYIEAGAVVDAEVQACTEAGAAVAAEAELSIAGAAVAAGTQARAGGRAEALVRDHRNRSLWAGTGLILCTVICHPAVTC